jgi:hypothetical protein
MFNPNDLIVNVLLSGHHVSQPQQRQLCVSCVVECHPRNERVRRRVFSYFQPDAKAQLQLMLVIVGLSRSSMTTWQLMPLSEWYRSNPCGRKSRPVLVLDLFVSRTRLFQFMVSYDLQGSERARTIIRPSTLVRCKWADEGTYPHQ